MSDNVLDSERVTYLDWGVRGLPDPGDSFEWRVPDWLNAHDYPDELAPRRAAWEFLRRNAHYRYSWAARCVEPWHHSDYGTAGAPFEFGLSRWVDPREGDAFMPSPQFRIAEAGEKLEVIRPGEVVVIFNLSAPLGPQLAAVKRRLARPIRGQSKVRGDKYPLYLRILDGHDAGASDNEMGQELFKEELAKKVIPDLRRRVRKARERAFELRDYDYLGLVAKG